ncbi:MAG: hypothetical protein JRG97_13325 [Deltaproteobacteria bacterium]|nr:hypothetical protein [Deltaproteobacteria bacterium]MBW2052926.1 hypothetical protein [Deltaproteobacteria bacterium]MBW2142027.1 hypothetical protein [Deltaproteobacteria bacterium]MBW2324438.1 hypothetical protein [Deltaproteobacteria bacterium]
MKISIQSEKFDSGRQGIEEHVKARSDLITRSLEDGAAIVLEQARKNVSGLVLNSRSGRLRGSLMADRAVQQGDTFSAWVGSKLWSRSGAINYGAVWEFGARGAVIRPNRAKALRWPGMNGKPVFSSIARRPAQAPRPWLGPAVENNISRIEDLLNRIYDDEQT